MIETSVMQELIISERSVAIFQIIVSEILSELLNIAKDVTNIAKYFLKTLHQYVCTFSTFTITRNLPTTKAHVS